MARRLEQDPARLPQVGLCNCATKRPSASSRPSCTMTASRRRDPARPRRWTSSITSGNRIQASRAYDHRYLVAVLTGAGATVHLPRRRRRCGAGKGPARKRASRRRSASIKAASSCRAILTCGPTSASSRWTSRGPASQPTRTLSTSPMSQKPCFVGIAALPATAYTPSRRRVLVPQPSSGGCCNHNTIHAGHGWWVAQRAVRCSELACQQAGLV